MLELTDEAGHKRVVDARLQLVIDDVAAGRAPSDDLAALERQVVRGLAHHGLGPPSDDWVSAVAAAIEHGRAYVISPQSVQDAEAMRRGEFPPDRAVQDPGPALGPASGIDPAPRPAVGPAPGGGPAPVPGDRANRALMVAGAALLVALWAFRSRRRR